MVNDNFAQISGEFKQLPQTYVTKKDLEASAKERERLIETAIQEMTIANARDRDELKTYVSVTQELLAWKKKEEEERNASK
jgi:uncharacterized protein (DUF2461 family)